MARIEALGGAIVPLLPDDELETPPLPREHPKWVKDALAVSQRARQLIANIKPAVIRVLTFWDHRTRGISIGSRELSVDTCGSYRLE
jgi:hypothetical protein